MFVREEWREQLHIGEIKIVAPCVHHHDGAVSINARFKLERRLRPGPGFTIDLKIIGHRKPAVRVPAVLEAARHGELLARADADFFQCKLRRGTLYLSVYPRKRDIDITATG